MTAAHTSWDLAVVGAGPAGAAAALGALHTDPALRVALLDRADFPRDKACGDGVAPHVLDVLADVGVTGLVEDRVPIGRLSLGRGGLVAERHMARPAWVVPRRILDARLVDAALAAGARLLRHQVRDLRQHTGAVALDERIFAAVVIGADGAHSVIRRALGQPRGPRALALRGYAPVAPGRRGAQVIEFGTRHQPSYAWSFDRGDGLANVGYGELLRADRPAPTRTGLLERLEALLPGATDGGREWAGHHLPLSTARWHPPAGRVLLAGDAACLVNPLTGEGIHHAVATGIAAGRAAAAALREGRPERAGFRYARTARRILLPHLRHTASAARLARNGRVLDAGVRAAAADQRVFDDLVELGLGWGRLTPGVVLGLGRALFPPLCPTGPSREPA
ncbi:MULTISPECIES: NAD(P)/FAD-dependent oxidoreductase [Streptomyces]|uniref:Geranylgeranyl reductase family protein n=1 Tax=Streptomyces sudanensis TaxID=436397 RepID=A0ABY4THZ9_9ACTN|nr:MULTISPECIES: geranylgeranyl reductase family protein [Streptomyces]MCP9956104.1 geranylgeranyl reductase family protein [Streptomyces sudanensis]MCP9985332.1 geranylgeranyl reductase family protein [Streptomyces sudanensis]MCP9989201.1 geranylgeranyl reductase family protein [Streptomyces sudanensis]MCQ0003299.1 geranylgeranyl reductase family protein [Streptomyces sudanensis]URN18528.1 geranylgeranyl reductase family protein [Streptomyces sudanensis]